MISNLINNDIISKEILELSKKVLNKTISEETFNQKITNFYDKTSSFKVEEYNYIVGQLSLLEEIFAYLKNEKEVVRSKYVTDIIEILKEQDVLSHTELAYFLGIKKNHLSNIVKKFDLGKEVNIKKVGRMKLYSLKKA